MKCDIIFTSTQELRYQKNQRIGNYIGILLNNKLNINIFSFSAYLENTLV